jgi:hypothetical protein
MNDQFYAIAHGLHDHIAKRYDETHYEHDDWGRPQTRITTPTGEIIVFYESNSITINTDWTKHHTIPHADPEMINKIIAHIDHLLNLLWEMDE